MLGKIGSSYGGNVSNLPVETEKEFDLNFFHPELWFLYFSLNTNYSPRNSNTATSFTEEGYILSIELFPPV